MRKSLDELMAHWFHGEITPEEVQQLQQHLLENPEHRTAYLKECQLEVLLKDDALDASLRAWSPDAAKDLPSSSKSRSKLIWLSFATLSCLTLAWALFHTSVTPPPVEITASTASQNYDAEDAAILTKVINTKWAEDQTPIQPGDILHAGFIQLEEGLAQFEFYEGATLLLEGPALLEIVSPAEGILHRGRARVHIPGPAHDFKLHSNDIVATSTQGEFGVSVNTSAESEHEFMVFEGSANLLKGNLLYKHLKTGDRLEVAHHHLAKMSGEENKKFVSVEDFEQNQFQRASLRFGEWKNWITQVKQDHRLLAFFPFGKTKIGERELCNSIQNNQPPCNGGIVGAKWTQGRWPNKDALEFRRPGDRVRLELEGEFDRVTFTCWVKVDSLERKYNGILLTDGFEHGEPHWQVSHDGRLLLSIADQFNEQNQSRGETFASPVIFSKSHFGRWHHLAVSYDRSSGEVRHYVDGKKVSLSYPSDTFTKPSIVFGRCELGNWGKPLKGVVEPIRNLNGCLDEFSIYKTVLTQKEVAQIFEAGKQD